MTPAPPSSKSPTYGIISKGKVLKPPGLGTLKDLREFLPKRRVRPAVIHSQNERKLQRK